MKFRFLLLMALSGTAFGQAVSYSSNVTQVATNVPAGASAAVMTTPNARVSVCAYPPTGTPCTNTTNVFVDQAMTVAIPQPLTADPKGRFNFWAPAGQYFVSVQTAKGVNVGSYPLTLGGSGGASGNPGGVTTNAQFNNAGAFGGSKATFDAAGNFNSLSLDGLRNAFLSQTSSGSNNGIANSLTASGKAVVAGPDYAAVEGVFGGTDTCTGPNWRDAIGCPAPFSAGTTLYDFRSGSLGTYIYNFNLGPIGGVWRSDRLVTNRQTQFAGTGSSIVPYLFDYEVTGSGKNGFGASFGPDTLSLSLRKFEFMRRGIMHVDDLSGSGFGVGDTALRQNDWINNRGNPDGSSEAFTTLRNNIHQNLTPLTTTANSTLAPGTTLIPGTLISNVPFPGDGTFYMNASHGSALFRIAASSDPGTTGAFDAGQLTIEGTAFTPDNIGRVAALVTILPQYYGATTNATITVTGLTSPIVSTSTVCYAGNSGSGSDSYMESARVVSVGTFSGGTQTITVALRYGHAAGSYLTQGPNACSGIDIRANQFPGTFHGRQLLRIIGALDSTHLLYSRIGSGHWLQALSGYATTRIVAAAGVTLTRNGSNVASVTVVDPFLVLSNDDIIVSGCADTSFNGLFVSASNNGSTMTWPNTGSAATTTCTNAIEIQSQLNGFSVREAQLFPTVEIVNTTDPTTFANNFNLSVEPNTNFVVTAGDQLEDQVYSEVGQQIDHNLMSFKTQTSPSIGSVIHQETFFDQIPEGTGWYSVTFQDAPNQYLGLGGTKPISNDLFEMVHSITPFNFLFHGLSTPATAAFTFNGCLYGCTDVRSRFDLFDIPVNGGGYSETIHQDTGEMDTVTGNGTNTSTVKDNPSFYQIILSASGGGNIQTFTPSDANSLVGGGGGSGSTVDQTSAQISNTVTGTLGAASHLTQLVDRTTTDVPQVGPATAPSGACTVTGSWVFSRDGHATFCNAGTWLIKI